MRTGALPGEGDGSTIPRVPRVPRVQGSLRAALSAVLLGFAVLILGGSVAGALMVANLAWAPAMPLFLPVTALWLGLCWRYLRGEGWPRTTAAWRRESLAGRRLSPSVWRWALLAGGLAVTATMGLAFVTYRFAALPEAAYRSPFDVASFPPWTLVAIFAALASTAAVIEEAAFRGYMLSGLHRRFGWAWGVALVTLLFYFAHLPHAYATWAFVPFFVAHGCVFGLLVHLTRSILPGIVLHALSDFLVLPMQYGAIPSAGRWDFVGQGWLSLVAGAAAIPALWKLARVTRAERSEPIP
jgi:membrane protease YdiL (CAAX protease family)